MRFGQQLGDLPSGYDHKYTYSHLGYNLKMSDMQAAVGLAQLDRLEGFIEARKRNFAHLLHGLQPLQEAFILPEATLGSDPSWFGFALTVREAAPFSRDALLIHLNQHKIATRLMFGGNLLRQPYMKGRPHRVVGSLTNSDRVTERSFWIGLYPGLDRPALDYMIEVIKDWCRTQGVA
jgi:CDP-6-deoxy-D-xylo-4-hexulose-3-dehydrase